MMNLKSGLLALVLLVGVLCVISLPRTAFAQITSSEDVGACLKACDPKALQEAAQACLTVDSLKACFSKKPECAKWSEVNRTDIATFCGAFGERMCGCWDGGSKPSSSSGSVAKPKRRAKPRAKPLSEKEGCEAKGGVWAEVTEESCDGDVCHQETRKYCFTLRHAYEAIEELKRRVAELEGRPAMGLTDEEVRLLRQIISMDFSKGLFGRSKWEDERDNIVAALQAICYLSPEDTAKLEAELQEEGGKLTLVAKCEAVRRKIDDNERRSKEAMEKADSAIKLVRPSLLRVSAVGGAHFVRSPRYNDVGNDVVAFGGFEAQWWHPITPGLALSLEGGLGYASVVYDRNSLTTWVGVGVGTELGTDVLGSAHLFASHFFSDDEWSKLNAYGVAPELTWAPGLSKKDASGVVPALTARLLLGMTRADIEGAGVVQDPLAGLVLGFGIMF